MKPLVSVIIPVYNVEPYLRKCVDSVIKQTYENIEIILIDDGSTDRSGSICDEYKVNDKRITVIHQNNSGLSIARNVGINNCKGDYICFIDSDDFVLPEFVETLLNMCLKNNTLLSVCCMKSVYDNPKKNHKTYELKDEILSNEEFIDKEIDVACAKLYKSELFSDIRFPPKKIHEDSFTYAQLAYKSPLISTTSKSLYMYYQHPQGRLSNSSKRTFDAEEAFLYTVKFLYEKNINKNLVNKLILRAMMRITLKKLFIGIEKNQKKSIQQEYKKMLEMVYPILSKQTKIKVKLPILATFFRALKVIPKKIYKSIRKRL